MTLKTILSNFLKNDSMSPEHKFKLLFRVLVTFRHEKQMQKLFESLHIEDILEKHPRFYNKFSRPHLKSNLNNSQKIRFIQQHYTYIVKKFNLKSIHTFYHDSAVLYDFDTNDIDLTIDISYKRFLEREGEIMMNLSQHDGTRIYSIAGTFYEGSFYISGIQGYNDIKLIRKYTKSCFGMRPHNLLYYALLIFCQELGIDMIYSISNEEQIYNEKKTKKKVLFNYETFFKNIYAEPLQKKNGWFPLDVKYPLKPIEEVKSKKRSMYRKRYALLSSVKKVIKSNIKLHLQAN